MTFEFLVYFVAGPNLVGMALLIGIPDRANEQTIRSAAVAITAKWMLIVAIAVWMEPLIARLMTEPYTGASPRYFLGAAAVATFMAAQHRSDESDQDRS